MKTSAKNNPLTARQEKILEAVCKEYIKTGVPVSSTILAKKYNLGLSSASVRTEMLELDRLGYLVQPHTSAGRKPSDTAYRFYVNSILENHSSKKREKNIDEAVEHIVGQKIKTSYELPQYISKTLAEFSHNLGFAGFLDEGMFYKHGFGELMANVAFKEKDTLKDLGEILDVFDDESDMRDGFMEITSLRVYIGRELPLHKSEHLSFIASPISFRHKKGIAGIFGAKRMDYEKNIAILKEISDILKQF